jgi:hypothetical protein
MNTTSLLTSALLFLLFLILMGCDNEQVNQQRFIKTFNGTTTDNLAPSTRLDPATLPLNISLIVNAQNKIAPAYFTYGHNGSNVDFLSAMAPAMTPTTTLSGFVTQLYLGIED